MYHYNIINNEMVFAYVALLIYVSARLVNSHLTVFSCGELTAGVNLLARDGQKHCCKFDNMFDRSIKKEIGPTVGQSLSECICG